MNLVIFWISKLFLQKYNKSYKQYIMYRKGLHIGKQNIIIYTRNNLIV